MNNYNFTDLILLVGTNPLPNLVTAKYFIKNNYKLNKIWFIYSKHTKNYKDKLIEAINSLDDEFPHKNSKFKPKQLSDHFQHIEVKERDSNDIMKKMEQIKSENNQAEFHLNYTCGTKLMVVHSYRALEKSLGNKISFSYVDPETFTLKDDNGSETGDLRNEITIHFEEMIKLHHHIKSESDDFQLSEIKDKVVKAFEEILKEGNIHNLFYSKNMGYNRKLFENKKGKLAEKLKDLDSSKLTFENNRFIPNKHLEKVLLAFGKYNIFDKNWNFKTEIGGSEDDPEKMIKFFTKFIDGGWFEYYIYKKIEEIKEKNDELTLSSEVFKDNLKKQDLEIDITYTKGYQLFGISCTTSNLNSVCKSKGFEVIQRSKQLGGDEAKSILITTMDNDNDKTQELQKTLSANKEDVFMVLGLEDLIPENLQKKLKKFIFKEEVKG